MKRPTSTMVVRQSVSSMSALASGLATMLPAVGVSLKKIARTKRAKGTKAAKTNADTPNSAP